MVTRAPAVQANPMMEMNTTPLIDVMLVLLIMFIITIPLQTHAVKLDLPTPGHAPIVQTTKNEIEITAAGVLEWNDQPVTMSALQVVLAASQQITPVPELHFRPDPAARYEVVDRVMALVKREHVQRFGFVGNEAYANW